MERYRIAVVGAGYVGMSLAVLLAQTNDVTVVEKFQERVDMINCRKSPIRDEYLERYLEDKKLSLRAVLPQMMDYAAADIVIIATPTNFDPNTGGFDTQSIEVTAAQINQQNADAVVVIKSTIPIGYTQKLKEETGLKNILFSPEFLRESRALYDELYPSRIVVGYDSSDPDSKDCAKLFASILEDNALTEKVPVFLMGYTEAETVKLFSNTYLAMRVDFFNELDTFAQAKGLRTQPVIEAVCADPRIGDFYNNPSFGYGGYCLPKDTKQLEQSFSGVPQTLVSAVVSSNETRLEFVARQILLQLKETGGRTVGAYRLIMKTGSDNFRDSAILRVIEKLCAEGIRVCVYEPTLTDGQMTGDLRIEEDFDAFCENCDLIIANRSEPELERVKDRIYTCDLYSRD
ncbi:MAG: nucleotide sugar dehydrogenase [Clostridia bacterium]|nr:nucleotide sugar dehydrogenase [Clostridia bacterium]